MSTSVIVGIGIVGAILAVTVKNARQELGIGVSIAVGCTIFALVLPYIEDLLAELHSLSQKSGVDFGYFEPVVKIIGVAYITQFSAEIIKDAGEGAVSKKVELAGKITILGMILPILKNLISVILSALALT